MRHLQLAIVAPFAALLVAGGAVRAGAQPAMTAVQQIAAGSVVERALQRDAADLFSVTLADGQFLNVIVEQRALDVRLRLLAPDGTAVVTCDSLNGPYGFERIAYVASRGGEYRVEVWTGASAPDGRYVLKVAAIRAPTPDDVTHAAAERAFLDAEALRRQPNVAQSRPMAVAKYHEAAAAFRQLGLTHELALALFSSGRQQLVAGNTREALPDLSAALELIRTTHDAFSASVMGTVGGAYDILGDADRAMALYREALDTVRELRSRTTEGTLLNNIGKLYADRGDWQQSLNYYRQAVPILHALGDVRYEGIALNNIGVAYESVGDNERALAYFEQSLEKRHAAKDQAGEADTLSELGRVSARLGDVPKALNYYDAALTLRRAVGDRRSESGTLSEVAQTQIEAGDAAAALALYDQALPLARGAGDRRREAVTLAGRAEALNGLKRSAEAKEDARAAAAIGAAIGDRANTAYALYVLARAERDLGETGAALTHAEESLRTVEEVRGLAAGRLLRTSFSASRHDVSTFYVDLLMREHRRDPSKRADIRALEASERARARSLIDLLNEGASRQAGNVDPALVERERQLSERLAIKSARLVNLLARGSGSAEADTLSREVHDLETEYDEVQAAVRQANPAYAAIARPPAVDVAALQRDLLDARTIVLEYSLGPDGSYLWAIEQRRIRSFTLAPADEIERAARSVYDLTIARADDRLPAAVARLSALVLAPVLPLPENARIVVVADGALQYVPFAMLSVGTRAAPEPLVVHAEVVNAPSLSVIATERSLLSGRKAPRKTIAIVADPVFDATDPRVKADAAPPAAPREDAAERVRLLAHLPPGTASATGVIPRLPFTAEEATTIAATAAPAATFVATGFAARKEAVLGDRLKDYRYVHFATHGFIDVDHPSLSAIVLSLVDAEGRPQDGFLRADELSGLDLSADLVVLSACETGLGKSIKGEGLIGLTRSLMQAGAPRVVVSLWSVSDRGTADLMSRFYREMIGTGKTPAAALRAAQIAMRQTARGRSPYYWAAFTLQGDWK